MELFLQDFSIKAMSSLNILYRKSTSVSKSAQLKKLLKVSNNCQSVKKMKKFELYMVVVPTV